MRFYQPIAVEWRLSGGKKPYLTVGYSTKYGKLSLHYLDERVGDHSCKNKTWTTDHAQHPVGLSGWDRPFGGSRCSTKFHSGRDFRLERFITSWLLPLLYGCFKIFFIPFSASLLHLALISVDRYVAMKFALRYESIVTTARIKSAVICVWLVSIVSAILSFDDFEILKYIASMTYFMFRAFALGAIVYCHISVYIVSRRHEKHIQAEQVWPEAVAKFLKDKKALKTTIILIGVLFMCYFPLIMSGIVKQSVPGITLAQPVFLSVALVNSMCNPVICCCRNNMFRKAFIELL